jgi:hypothetical protein
MSRPIAKAFLDTLDLRRGSVITMQEISCLQRHLVRLARQDVLAPDKAGEVADAVAVGDVADTIAAGCPYQVDDASAAVAKAWWQNAVLKASGARRDTRFTREIDCESMRNLYDVLHDGCLHVTFVGWATTYFRGYQPMQFDPEFVMHGTTGTTFAFVQRPWQRGGNVASGW